MTRRGEAPSKRRPIARGADGATTRVTVRRGKDERGPAACSGGWQRREEKGWEATGGGGGGRIGGGGQREEAREEMEEVRV